MLVFGPSEAGLKQSAKLLLDQTNRNFENHKCHFLWSKNEKDHPACYEQAVEKFASLMAQR